MGRSWGRARRGHPRQGRTGADGGGHHPSVSASVRLRPPPCSFPPMLRFPAFDPPEYVDWKADAALVRAFRETVGRDAERRAVVEQLSDDEHDALYAGLLRARLHDIQLKRWVKTGVISKAWLGTGEEATTVGPVHALQRGQD